jgi:hypothetical protein
LGIGHPVRFLDLFSVSVTNGCQDERQKSIGLRNQENMEAMLDSLALWPCTNRLGWTAEQVKWCSFGAKEEIKDKKLKLYLPL